MRGSSLSTAKTALEGFINAMSEEDYAALVEFNDYGRTICDLSSTDEQLIDGVNSLVAQGGTNVSSGIYIGIANLLDTRFQRGNEKVMVLICDGDVNDTQNAVELAIENDIKIYTVNVRNSQHSKLQSIATQTGGEYYYAYIVQELVNIIYEISSQNLIAINTFDKDKDGLPDVFEKNGMRLANGQIIYTDPDNPDTDGDGLKDGYEMGQLRSNINIPQTETYSLFPNGQKSIPYPGMYIGYDTFAMLHMYFECKSSPIGPDEDGDGVYDIDDNSPLKYEYSGIISKGEFGSIEFEDQTYNIVVQDHTQQYITSSSHTKNQAWVTVDERLLSDYKFDGAKFWAGLNSVELGEPKLKNTMGLSAMNLFSGVLTSANASVDSNYILFSF